MAPGSTVGFQPPAATTDPGESLAKRERATRLLAAMDTLPSEHRQMLQLRNFDGLSFADIAARMNRTEPAVRQLWVRAVRQLGKALG
jgi:RNA polymerase sigma-70 factor (ECF subfamily)